ncbi:hypothetical protein IU414_18275 [Nocardia farcinica]|uniref:site-specific integrase n=1 Tax=Nocardia farcinica TaxID=37329 RepID=UPI0018934F9A|nr:site-specific integrase [Nocardia farcinica]MBF6253925.1 hypothetical protein [Nocardia farcinica]MBF6284063.1 hypothetical protein [Nocardia farcinica]MBF6308095.1 hypothetical protein [Nocardia farcinica]MBF6511658.1 hypothetical protein [Nocardia farcinica]MBF6566717.1 hypothetical protein [Nocardia farcinica]
MFWTDPGFQAVDFESDPVLAGLPSLAELARSNGTRAGQPFLLRSDGVYATEVNEFFASVRMRGVAEGTRRKYASELSMWLGFLDAVGCCWADATEQEVDAFKFWRMTDESNPRRVAGGTFRSGLVAMNAFHEWAERQFGVVNPVQRTAVRGASRVVEGYRAAPRVMRDRDVKWLDPGGYRRWRDVGLRGLDVGGREIDRWRGRCPQRDCAFVDGLYGTGLRLTECASLLEIELPYDDPARQFMTCTLAAACAKGSVRRKFWMPRRMLVDVLAYIEGERAAAVRRAQARRRYERVGDRRILLRVLGGRRIEVREVDGRRSSVPLDALGPAARRRLFRETPAGLVPVAVWLNADGMPRAPHGWQHTFTAANARVARAGLVGLAATAHVMRHSFALRWFSVGRLLYEQRFAHLNPEEMRDFRAQFGDTWYFVMTLLGHRVAHHRPDGDAGGPRTALAEMLKPRRGRSRAHMTVALTDAGAGTGERIEVSTPFGVYGLVHEMCAPVRERLGTDQLFCYYTHMKGKLFRPGLRLPSIGEWSRIKQLPSDSDEHDAEQPPLVVDARRLRMTWLALHQQPVAHTDQTLVNDYLARNRGDIAEYQKIVAATLDEQVSAARRQAVMHTLTAEQVDRARTDPEAVAAEIGVSQTVLTDLLKGHLDTVMAGCIDHHHSPHAPAGQPCTASFLMCLSCPCARATPAHLPVIVAVHDRLHDKAREMTPLRWAQRFAGPAAQLADILDRYPPVSVAAARSATTTEQHDLVERLLARSLDLA